MSDYEDRDLGRGSDDDDYDDDEDDGLYNQDADAYDRKQLFREAQNAIRDQKGNFLRGEDLDVFLSKYRSVVGQTVDDQVTPTLLHSIVQMAKHNGIKSSDIKPLVLHIVKEYPDILRYTNDKGENSLYLAIGYKKWMIVEYMIDGCSDPENLADAIAGPCKNEDNKTSLHLALEKDLRPQVTEKLIKHARDETLGRRDATGKTALHYGVAYSQCSDARAKIIEMFVARDERLVAKLKKDNPGAPVKTFLDEVDKHDLSVYRQHLETKASYVPPKVSKTGDEDGKKQSGAGKTETVDQPPSVARGDLKVPDRQRDPKFQAGRDRDREQRARGRRGEGEDRDRDADRGEREGRRQDDEKLDERERARRELREREAREREARERRERDRGRQVIGREDEGRDGRDGRRDEMKPKGPIEALKAEPLPNIVTSGHTRAEPSPNTPLKRVNSARLEGPEEPKKEKTTQSSKKKLDKPDPKSLAKNSEKILTRLKLHYMRTRNTETATAFLYGKNVEGIQICFEYYGLPEEVKEEVFVKSFGRDHTRGIKFDKVLRYVSFPKVVVKRTPGRRAPKDTGAAGRRDMQFFFEWLYNKGVRHIIRVNVDDTSTPAHSEEAIQNSLEKIVVEQLNWQKVDLDPRTICRAGTKIEKEPGKFEDAPSQLTDVALRWSGNNAVLRAWSEPEGLALLPKLSGVHLHMPPATEMYDSQQWVDNNVNEFRDRLDKNIGAIRAKKETKKDEESNTSETKPTGEKQAETPKSKESTGHVTLFKIHGSTGKSQRVLAGSKDNAEPASASTQIVTSHQWLDCMDLFASKFKPFWDQTLSDFLKFRGERAGETAEGVEKDVVVALIDDGVDSCDDALAGQILDGKTFDYQEDSMGPHFVSAKGHGTVMASMISRVCPMAKIYPIRLKTRQGEDGKSQIVVKSAALAIQAALDKGANIISMSWTVPIPEENTEEKALLTAVLERAVKSKALMFCSSPDTGNFTSVDYPTAYNRERFFRIGAAKDNGTIFGWAGSIDNLDFILPGVDVVRNHSTKRLSDRVKDIQSETGSSVATALAAGLAATIIYCVKACALAILTANASKGGDDNDLLKIIPPGEANRIAEHAYMKEAFHKLGTVTESRFIQVWESVGSVNEVFKDDFATQKQKLERLIAFSTKLIPIRR